MRLWLRVIFFIGLAFGAAEAGEIRSGDICRAVIASIMANDISIIKVDEDRGNIVVVGYEKSGEYFQYSCRGSGSSFEWSSYNPSRSGSGFSRWKSTDFLGLPVRYEVSGQTVVVFIGSSKPEIRKYTID